MKNSVSIAPATVARIRVALRQFKDLQVARGEIDYAAEDWRTEAEAIEQAMVTWAHGMAGTMEGVVGE